MLPSHRTTDNISRQVWMLDVVRIAVKGQGQVQQAQILDTVKDAEFIVCP